MKASFVKSVVFVWLDVFLAGVLMCLPANASGGSTRADPNDPNELVFSEEMLMQGTETAAAAKITFSEFDTGTYITDQYADRGIIFGGDSPQTMNDSPTHVPTTPVLGAWGDVNDPGTQFQGDIEGYFVSPHDGTTLMTVSWFSFTAGWFEEIGATRIEWFDINNNKLGDANNLETGVYQFNIEGEGIASWRIGIITTEPAGYAIDNVNFDNPYLVKMTKDDNVNDLDCVYPENEITYTICYENTTDQTFYNTYIIDYLPAGVDYDYIDWSTLTIDPNYNEEDHSYVFQIGTILPNDSGCVELTVTVNEKSDPLTPLHNVAELWDNDIRLGDAEEDTPVCIWDMGGIIYVDVDAPAGGNGISWEMAYNDLQDGIARANLMLANDPNDSVEIWVANGTYNPGDTFDWYYYSDTFEIPAGVAVYGGYAGYGAADPNERDPKQYETILSGVVNETSRNDTVVAMKDGSVLDGVTITDAANYGVYGSGDDFTLEHCTIEDNQQYGIYAQNGDVQLNWCTVQNNDWYGIYHSGSGYVIDLENCQINNNKQYGVLTENSTPTIKNSIITQNGYADTGYFGIRIYYPENAPILYNNTIALNRKAGVSWVDNDADYPDIQGCILYYNNDNGAQLSGLTWEQVEYCCIPDCNDINNQYNINDEPGFAYPLDPNYPLNYHLAWNSPCKDKGNPNHDNGDVGLYDMDQLERIVNERVDIGADEVNCEDVSNPLDFNGDGFVNMLEYSKFAAAWLSHDPNEPGGDPNLAVNWDPVCNLDASGDSAYVVDLADLLEFVGNAPVTDHWCWTACWLTEEWQSQMQMSMPSSGGENILMAEVVIPAQAGIQPDSAAESVETAIVEEQPVIEEQPVGEEKTLEEQIFDLQDSIDFLEQLWLQEPDIQQQIDADDWQNFMDSVYQNLLDLQAENSQTEE